MRPRRGLALIAAAAVGAACSSGDAPTAAGGTPATPVTPVGVSCTPTASAITGPVNDPNGPYFHQVVIGTTTDGLTLSGVHQVIDHASVPDGVWRSDGSVLVYYVNGATGGVDVARIVADTAQVIGPITVDGVSRPAGIVDPDVQTVAGGKVRLFYLNGFGTASSAAPRAMCSADSDDGIRFTTRGPAFTWTTSEQFTDPSVVPLTDGSWLMAISLGQQTVIARSANGLAFVREATFSFGGVPELAIAPDGALRLYVCGAGIVAYRSTDSGRSWARERTVVSPPVNGHTIVCDPSLVAGTNLFVFKTG